MTRKRYDLAVAYRVYPRVSKHPVIFGEDKYKLAEACLRSFQSALGGLRARVWALLDGCPPEYERLFRSRFAAEDLEVVNLPGVGNFETFTRQVEILAGQDAAEYVYFAEDDYFYLPGAVEEMVAFARAHAEAHFVSAYDHLDYYTLELHRRPSAIATHGGRHWRTVGSTCLTFLTTREHLRRTRPIFDSYRRRNNDASLWLILTKQGAGLFNPLRMARYAVTSRDLFKYVVKAWWFGWRRLLFGKRWKCWVPMPSLSTHMERRFLAPCVDWKEKIASAASSLEALRS